MPKNTIYRESYDMELDVDNILIAQAEYDNKILAISDSVGEGIINDGGVTRNLGRFMLAMHGNNGDYGREVPDSIIGFYANLNETFGDCYDLPVATFYKDTFSEGGHKIKTVGYAPMRGRLGHEPSPVMGIIERDGQLINGRFVGRIALDLRDVRHFSPYDSTQLVEQAKSAVITVARVKTYSNHFSDNISVLEDYETGWEAIYARRKLGTPSGARYDKVFLQILDEAEESFKADRRRLAG